MLHPGMVTSLSKDELPTQVAVHLQSPENITVARSLTGGRSVKQWKFGGRYLKIEIWRKGSENISDL